MRCACARQTRPLNIELSSKQVIALRLRSGAKADGPPCALEQELDYPRLLNRQLPDDIRVLGWAPVEEGFSARFSCERRHYKYFIVQRGDLDIPAMQVGSRLCACVG